MRLHKKYEVIFQSLRYILNVIRCEFKEFFQIQYRRRLIGKSSFRWFPLLLPPMGRSLFHGLWRTLFPLDGPPPWWPWLGPSLKRFPWSWLFNHHHFNNNDNKMRGEKFKRYSIFQKTFQVLKYVSYIRCLIARKSLWKRIWETNE